MELTGNEKRIQTLFHELKHEDERSGPSFSRILSGAQATNPTRRGYVVSFAVATALSVVTLGALAFWMHNSQRAQQPGHKLAFQSPPVQVTKPLEIAQQDRLTLHDAQKKFRLDRAQRRLAAHRRVELGRNAAIYTSAAISNWQSPTVALMGSPADEVLTAVPTLNRSLFELKSFLPNTPK